MSKKEKNTVVFYTIVLSVVLVLTMIGRYYEYGYIAIGWEPFAAVAGAFGLIYYVRSRKATKVPKRKKYTREAYYAKRNVW